jgi:hypothetical protein
MKTVSGVAKYTADGTETRWFRVSNSDIQKTGDVQAFRAAAMSRCWSLG